MGGSAGGFTVLHTMSMHPHEFTAGVCLYGVADHFHLAAMTHKFEARYTDRLIGEPFDPATARQQTSEYFTRSPVHSKRLSRNSEPAAGPRLY